MIELGIIISYLYSCTAKNIQQKLRCNKQRQKLMVEVKLKGFRAGRLTSAPVLFS